MQGILAIDPINAEATAWMGIEIDKRFGQLINYLVFSHSHTNRSAIRAKLPVYAAPGPRPESELKPKSPSREPTFAL